MAILETIELALLAGLLFLCAGAVAGAIAYPRLRGWLGRIVPATRANVLLLLAGLPVLAAILFTALVFLPGELGTRGFVDHCTEHPGHVHLCLVHHPPLDQGLVGWAAALLALVALVAAAVRQGRRLLRSARAVQSLRHLADRPADDALWNVIEADAPLSATAGLLRPAVYLSSGFLRAVDADVLEVVRAHERAHVRRLDPLRQVVAAVLALAHLPRTRCALLNDLALAVEQASDEEAARLVGDRERVARAVLAVERVLAANPPASDLIAASFGGSHVKVRVESLLSEAQWKTPRGFKAWLTVSAVVLVLAASSLHHATETLLNWLTR